MATHFSIHALENPMDTAAWQAIVPTVAQSDTPEATEHACVE